MGSPFARLARGARRIGRVLRPAATPLTVVAVLAVAAVVATMVRRTGDDPPVSGGSSWARVGVADGDSVAAYLTAQRQELAGLAARDPNTPVYALVSLSAYLTPAQVAVLVRSAEERATPTSARDAAAPTRSAADGLITVAGYARVPLPDAQTELVRLPASRIPDDLLAGMQSVADRKAAEAAEAAKAAEAARADATKTDATKTDATKADVKADATKAVGARQDDGAPYASIAAVAARESAAYRAECGCVFALVVRATPVMLSVFGGLSGVRVVDPAADLHDVARVAFVPLLPEQVDTVGPIPVSSTGKPSS